MDPYGTVAAGDRPEPPAEQPAPPGRRGISWPARIAIALAVVLAAGGIAGLVIRVPYTTIAPGDALSLPPLVSVQGAPTYSTARGDIRLLFVREAYHVNLWQYVRARLDSEIDLAKDAAINPANLSPTQQQDQGLQQMADAKSAATAVALTAAGYKVGVERGLVVSDLVDNLPAIKVLNWGDVILTADGYTVTDAVALSAAIAKRAVGAQVVLGILRAGKSMTVHVGVASDHGRRLIGVMVSPRFTFPMKVNVDTTGIGGPSAGLAMSLAILDDLTPGDLTGGTRVAVTGTIDAAGNVGEIGGIEQKAVAARAAHVSLFIVPQCSPDDPPTYLAGCKADLTRAIKRAGSKIKVMPVSTFTQALAVLRSAGGAPVVPVAPTTSTTIAA
jgi:Lon-like protease